MTSSWRVYVREHPQFGSWYTRVGRQPSWVTRTAITVAVLVLVVPLILLALTAVVVGLGVFIVLGLAAMLLRSVREVFTFGQQSVSGPSDDGRRNVKVIRD